MSKKLNILLLVPILLFLNCSIQKWTMSKISENFSSNENTVFTGDDDPELIGDALPFTMKLYESLLAKDSTNPELYLASGKLFCLYAQGFVLFPADTLPDSLTAQKKAAGKRAKKLFLRGRDYILKALDLRHPHFLAQIKSGAMDSALLTTTQSDSSYLYWGAASWMGAIAADRSDLGLAMTLKKAIALANKLSSTNETYGFGALNELYCIYYASAPKSLGGDTAKARLQLTKAISASNNSKVSPFVSGALSLSVKNKNREEFEQFLNSALSIDINAYPQQRLQNTIYQQRAKWLLEHEGRYFGLTPSPSP